MPLERDQSPIDQKWVQEYCDQFTKVAQMLGPDTPLGVATIRRIECVMDLVDAWQKRKWPIEQR